MDLHLCPSFHPVCLLLIPLLLVPKLMVEFLVRIPVIQVVIQWAIMYRADQLVGQLADLLVGQLVDQLADQLVDQLDR